VAEAATLDTADGVATLRLNRPDKLNAVNHELREALLAHLEAVETDTSVRAVVLMGEGRAFCSGADQSGHRVEKTPAAIRRRMAEHHAVIHKLWSLSKPVVAAVRGAAVGVGWSCALCCDVVVASESAQFWHPLIARGGIPDGGAIWLLSRQVGVLRAQDIVYTCRKVGAGEALAMGLVNAVVADPELAETALQRARGLAAMPALAIDLTKSLFHANAGTLEEQLRIELGHIPLASMAREDR